MSEDEKLREAARIRERALHDEASYIQDAMEEGIAKGRMCATKELIEKLRGLGADEEMLRKAMES